MKVTVFGGSHPKEGSKAYAEAQEARQAVGSTRSCCFDRRLHGHDRRRLYLTAAAEAGGHVIGVTCEDIERWRTIGPNKWARKNGARKR